MKHLSEGMSVVFSRRDSRAVLISVTLVFFILLLMTQNGKAAATVFSFDSLTVWKRIWLFLVTFFDISNNFNISSLLLSVLGSLLGGINLSLAYVYIRTRGKVILRSGLYSGLGLLFAYLGIGCAACGTAFVAVILSFLGLSAMLHSLPYQGQEIGYIGIIFLCMATYTLAKRVASPLTC